jgi:hypothetical protein
MLAHRDEAGLYVRPRAVPSRSWTAPRHRCRTIKLTRTVARVAQWLLPWTSVLILCGTIAHALDAGLPRTQHEPLPGLASAMARSNVSCPDGDEVRSVDLDPWIPAPPQNDCPLESAEPGAHWLTLGAVESDGSVTSLNCLASADRVVHGMFYVPAEEMDAVVSEVCLKTWL